MTTDVVNLLFSFVATAIAVASYMRFRLQELPTVEFLATRDACVEVEYWLNVSKLSRRSIILNLVEDLSSERSSVESLPYSFIGEISGLETSPVQGAGPLSLTLTNCHQDHR